VNGQFILGGGIFDLDPKEKPPLRLELTEPEEDSTDLLQSRIQWQKILQEVNERASRGLPLATPSSFLGWPDSSRFSWDEFPGSTSEPGGGAAFGSAFHEVMEQVNIVDGKNLNVLAKMKASNQSLPKMAERIDALCRQTLSHSLLERVRRSKRFFREVPFSVSLEEKIMEGKIDLLFHEDEGWVIVDYKTDEVSGEALEQRFQSYREQGIWYAKAVQKAAGGKVKEMVFFFVRAGEARSIEGKDIFC
jgi:ATP-dependent exoDNAse (exonuclease V) beta subunit